LKYALPKGLQRVRDCSYLRENIGKIRQRIQVLLMNTKDWTIPDKQEKPKPILICYIYVYTALLFNFKYDNSGCKLFIS